MLICVYWRTEQFGLQPNWTKHQCLIPLWLYNQSVHSKPLVYIQHLIPSTIIIIKFIAIFVLTLSPTLLNHGNEFCSSGTRHKDTEILMVPILYTCMCVCVHILLVLFLFADEEKRRSAGRTEQVPFFCPAF